MLNRGICMRAGGRDGRGRNTRIYQRAFEPLGGRSRVTELLVFLGPYYVFIV